jgi:hypothetical protein
MRLIVVFLLLVIFFLGGPAISTEPKQDFQHWVGACTGDGYCTATNFISEGPDGKAVPGYVLSIGRPAQQTYWEISFTPLATEADAGQNFTTQIDDETLTVSGPDEIGAYGAPNAFYFLGRGAQALLDKIVPGASLTVNFADRSGAPQTATFPLAGLSTALIWIDTRQHRIGSERVAETPPYGLEPVQPAAAVWMSPAIAAFREK